MGQGRPAEAPETRTFEPNERPVRYLGINRSSSEARSAGVIHRPVVTTFACYDAVGGNRLVPVSDSMLEMHVARTRGDLEAEISQAINRFEKEWMGRGPVETRTYIIDDLVLVRLKTGSYPRRTQASRSGRFAARPSADQATATRTDRAWPAPVGSPGSRHLESRNAQPAYGHQFQDGRTDHRLFSVEHPAIRMTPGKDFLLT